MTWSEAVKWANDLVYQGYDDWRLPNARNQDGSGPWVGFIQTSELGHLYYVELGNTAKSVFGYPENTGPFINLLPRAFWTGNLDADTLWGWYFGFNYGYQDIVQLGFAYIPWAVRDGDSTPVPEPSLMVLLGISMMSIVGLKRWLKQ